MFKDKEETVDFKKKREEYTQAIRKNNREEIFSKKRNIIQADVEPSSIEVVKHQKVLVVDSRFEKEIREYLGRTYTMEEDFYKLVSSINSADILKQHLGLIGIRKILSVHDNPPIQAVIDAGLVPKMIEYVKQQQYPQLQLEATWTLTNVASGTTIQCQSIIDKGGIPLFVSLLLKKNLGIVEQAIWAIGNIASDCTYYRDTVLREGGLTNLIKLTSVIQDPTILMNIAWTMSNLCRGSPLPKYDLVKNAVPVMCDFINRGIIDDDQVLSDLCWAISYNCEGNRQRIQKVINTGVVIKIIKFLQTSFLPLLVPALRIIGNISTGDANQTDQLMKCNILNWLENLLNHQKKVVRRETSWVISNIAAGSRQQVETIINRQSLIIKLIEIFGSDATEIRKQVCFIFSNFAYAGQPAPLYQLYKNHDILEYYVDLLAEKDSKAVQISLECLFVVLSVGEKVKTMQNLKKNLLREDLLTMGAVDILQKLQYHQSEAVYNNVVKILTHYFEIEDPLAS